GAGKGPDVARRIGDELDHDLVARDAVREVAGRDRELRPRERAPDTSANEAGRAVGADQPPRAPRSGGGVDPESGCARTVERDISDARRQDVRSSAARGGEQRAIEVAPARDDER